MSKNGWRMARSMLERNHFFLSVLQFKTTASRDEFLVVCPKCSHSTLTPGFKKDVGIIDGKRTTVYYIECQRCRMTLCFPSAGTSAPTPMEFSGYVREHIGTGIINTRKERERLVRQFEDSYDTRTQQEKYSVKRAIKQRVKEWATANNIQGVHLQFLQQNALSLAQYGINDDLGMVEPELRTVGDVKRELDKRLPHLTLTSLTARMILERHDATQHAVRKLMQDEQQSLHKHDDILD